MHQTFILVTQEAEKLGAKHRPIFFWDTLYIVKIWINTSTEQKCIKLIDGSDFS